MPTPAERDRSNADEPRRLLADHHVRIEAACEELRAAGQGGDPVDVIARYRSLEHAVLEHLHAEEESIIPEYSKYAPRDAELIRTAHDELRQRLQQVGVEVELHCVRSDTIDGLTAALRAHAADEDLAMYPWAEANLPPSTRRQLLACIGNQLRALANDAKRVVGA
jgi:hypothetical protein